MTRPNRLQSLTELMADLESGRISSVEATEACLRATEAWQPKINAFVSVDGDAALAAEPEHYQAYDSRAFVHWQLGDLEATRADLKRAAALAPEFWGLDLREDRFPTVLIRRYLKALGHYGGPLDGDFDDMTETMAAIRAYETSAGLPPTGAPTMALLTRLAETDRAH